MLCPVCNQQLCETEANGFVYHICKKGCNGILINNADLNDILEFPEVINLKNVVEMIISTQLPMNR